MLLLLAVLSGCGSSEDPATAKDAKEEQVQGFTVAREDGSTYTLIEFQAICPKFPEGDPDAGYVHGYASLTGAKVDLKSNKLPKGPVAMISVLDEVPDGTKLTLPVDEAYGEEETGAVFFIYEPDEKNEASSSEEESTGTLEIIHAACEPTPVLEVRFDGTLGSEFSDNEKLKVQGYGRIE